MYCRNGIVTLAITALTLVFVAQTTLAVAPTEQAIEKWKAEGVLDQKLASWQAFKAAGGCSPSAQAVLDRERFAARQALNANAVDTDKVLVLLVEFPDAHFSAPVGGINQAIDSILFSDKTKGGKTNPTGSMVDFYREISYGTKYIKGSIYGPYTASQPYSYYIGTDNGFAHSPELVREVLQLGNSTIDYTQFSEFGSVPSVVVIHCGVGAEGGGTGIWSHKSAVGSLTLDGISFGDYTMNPELVDATTLAPIGVFCHEYGHVLGLPDLYDTQYHTGSEGIGRWSLMASGNYNGNGQSPAHPDAWCKIELGYIPIDSIQFVGDNLSNVQIPCVEYAPKLFLIPDSVWMVGPTRYFSQEYFLVENRQFRGSDVGLPGSGLVIYHVDRGVSGNNNPSRYQVAVVQADGLNQLATPGGNRGDGGDVYPGASNNRNLHNLSTPNTKLNVGAVVSEIGVWNISNSDSVMTADLDYFYSRPYLALSGTDSLQFLDTAVGANNDSIIDAGEPIMFYCKVLNSMRQAYNWSVKLSCDDPDVQFDLDSADQGLISVLNPALGAKKSEVPVRFHLAPGAQGSYATFTLTIMADSVFHAGDRLFRKTFTFKKMVGSPQVLVVDDDNGGILDKKFSDAFQRLGIPYRIWNKATGAPTASDLLAGKNVFWMQGAVSAGSTLTSGDIAAMQGLLDGGGNLCVASTKGPSQLFKLDSLFMQTYFKAQPIDSVQTVYFFGQAGSAFAQNSKYKFAGSTPLANLWVRKLTPLSGGLASFVASTHINGASPQGTVGVTSSNGTYKTILQSLPFEYISAADTGNGFMIPDSFLVRVLGFFSGSLTGIDDQGDRNLPNGFALDQNYPNPFNPSTTISYTIPAGTGIGSSKAHTQLAVYNLLGQKVKTLVDADQGPGSYSVEWDGKSDRGTVVGSGVYFYRLDHGDVKASKKMVLLK
ncbi:MAG: M6 family metalloprotease domain-containing protein [Candidatus Zixiibacteriota bacterium]